LTLPVDVRGLHSFPTRRSSDLPDAAVERMRRDIRFQFKGVRQPSGDEATIAFSLSYRGRDPGTVARVANALAVLYVQENAKIRRSEEHTSELQSLRHLVCRLLL